MKTKKLYDLNSDLVLIKRAFKAAKCQKVNGISVRRLPESLISKLEEEGYTIYYDQDFNSDGELIPTTTIA